VYIYVRVYAVFGCLLLYQCELKIQATSSDYLCVTYAQSYIQYCSVLPQPAPPRSAKKSASLSSSKHHFSNINNTNASYLAPTANTTNSAVTKYTSKEAERQVIALFGSV